MVEIFKEPLIIILKGEFGISWGGLDKKNKLTIPPPHLYARFPCDKHDFSIGEEGASAHLFGYFVRYPFLLDNSIPAHISISAPQPNIDIGIKCSFRLLTSR